MTTTTYENSVRIGSSTYRLVATADPELSVHLAGTDSSGALVAEGTLRLPADAGAKLGRLLGQVLDALGRLSGPPPTAPGHRPANANQPWGEEQDEELRAEWLTAGGGPSADLIRTIARRLERSPTSIRSRLARIGCDPDVPGRALSDQGARVYRVQGRDLQGPDVRGPDVRGPDVRGPDLRGPDLQGPDQGRVRGKPDSAGEGVD
ncbi:hypothetical protein [Saccharothrix syringae]|uniref:hypothetical protein n=1 Tax=Saccharothrix syringae TaxID=103733 RepID=UPI000B1A8C1F|nr:hypothetical protein [Saccharothrix syringae]